MISFSKSFLFLSEVSSAVQCYHCTGVTGSDCATGASDLMVLDCETELASSTDQCMVCKIYIDRLLIYIKVKMFYAYIAHVTSYV